MFFLVLPHKKTHAFPWRYTVAFSDFPWPETATSTEFPRAREVQRYLAGYAERYRLWPHDAWIPPGMRFDELRGKSTGNFTWDELKGTSEHRKPATDFPMKRTMGLACNLSLKPIN